MDTLIEGIGNLSIKTPTKRKARSKLKQTEKQTVDQKETFVSCDIVRLKKPKKYQQCSNVAAKFYDGRNLCLEHYELEVSRTCNIYRSFEQVCLKGGGAKF